MVRVIDSARMRILAQFGCGRRLLYTLDADTHPAMMQALIEAKTDDQEHDDMKAILDKIDKENRLPQALTPFRIGDTVKVSVKIKEGDKERIQAYSGIVIARKGGGSTETFTVRRISFGEGVERIFCVHSPNIAKIEVEGSSQVRRAKLYYLRKLTGKNARMKKSKDSPVPETAAPGTAPVAQV